MTQEGDGRLRAEFRLWDTFAGQQLIGEQFFANKAQLDAVYRDLTSCRQVLVAL